MAPKKKGPFYFLLLELQKERRERNLPFSLDAVREEAGERWKSLTEQQKAHYEALANRHKEMKVGSLENKLTSDGRTIASVLREQSEEINQRKEMVASIQRYVDDIGTVDEIKKFPFYILATNILCEANGVYYPLEIGLIEYSIEQGFIRAYHKFINPGRIPLGFASAAKDHSEDTHGIPITGFELGTTNYWAVVQDLMAYLRLPRTIRFCRPSSACPTTCPRPRASCGGLKSMRDSSESVAKKQLAAFRLMFAAVFWHHSSNISQSAVLAVLRAVERVTNAAFLEGRACSGTAVHASATKLRTCRCGGFFKFLFSVCTSSRMYCSLKCRKVDLNGLFRKTSAGYRMLVHPAGT
ncbi:hypothetical protein HPB51_027319 [Rhipicephalus microplus]|uniref:HMG box domain-containing protein n=1 Tax=Rhipicephalus microplus TaxID=6941 RepID=A0A9J6D0R3_RHIMP|nr:hypothetical protein HPB51_027319 [Rhipicephalus microplus]